MFPTKLPGEKKKTGKKVFILLRVLQGRGGIMSKKGHFAKNVETLGE